jgi:hypothetical protein
VRFPLRQIYSVLILLFLALGGDWLYAQDLEIKRTKQTTRLIQEEGLPDGWKRLGDDLFQVRFSFPHFASHMYRYSAMDEAVDDPFGGGVAPAVSGVYSAQQAIESIGIPFGELASVTYDPTTGVLKVTNTANSIELIDFFAGSIMGSGPPAEIAVRLEIYEMSKLQALQLQESSAAEGDHTPERAAALDAVRNDSAKLVTTVSLTTTIGQRAKLVDAVDFFYPCKVPLPAEGKDTEQPTGFDSREVGTILEVEPNLNADGITINLNIDVEHHTAEPEMGTVIDGLAEPKFHAKSIQTNIELGDGNYVLLGSWTPTGTPENVDRQVAQVVFVTASLQQECMNLGIILTEEVEGGDK